jgi:hypothetical protein
MRPRLPIFATLLMFTGGHPLFRRVKAVAAATAPPGAFGTGASMPSNISS